MQRHPTIEDIFPEVSRLSVGDLLGRDCFTVPEFQRPYSWKEQQVEQFWEDIYQSYERGDPLFLGVMVFQRQKEDPQSLQIIDGHQRICTIFVTLLAIRESIIQEGRDSRQLEQYIWKFNIRNQRERSRLSLTNVDDQQVLGSLLEGRTLIRENRLSETYAFLQHKIQTLQRNGVDLLDFCDFLLNQVFIVKILVGEGGDPYSTFEVLNARGLELTCWDLVKNRLLALANRFDINEVDSTKRFISSIENLSIESYSVDSEFLTKFLRHYWLSWKARVSKPKLYKAISEHLEQVWWICEDCGYVHIGEPPERCPSCNNERSFYQSRPSTFTRELLTELQNYISLIEPDDDTTEARDLEDLAACGFEQGRPLLMAVRRRGTAREFDQALKIVSTLHIRYHVCELNPNELERFFSESAIAFRRGERSIEDIRREASQHIPEDNQFIDKLTKEELSKSVAKYLLRKVEESRRDHEALRERPIGRDLDLEHIMPRKRSNEWPNHDPRLVKKLGNLTLVGPGYNRRVRNRGFERKLEEFRRSELKITRELTRFSSWGREEIEERGRELARAIAEIFRI